MTTPAEKRSRSGIEEIIYAPLNEVTKPVDGEVATNRWWIAHPETGDIMFVKMRGYPGFIAQCNTNKKVTEAVRDRLYGDHDIVHVEAVYLGAKYARPE
jgi:hypothetical protein